MHKDRGRAAADYPHKVHKKFRPVFFQWPVLSLQISYKLPLAIYCASGMPVGYTCTISIATDYVVPPPPLDPPLLLHSVVQLISLAI